MLLGALTAGAAASVAAIPAIAATDPVLGLVEAHKSAWTRLLSLEDYTDDYETLEEAGRAVDVAINEITRTPPTMLGGMRTVIEYLVELDGPRRLSADTPAIVDPPLAAAGGLSGPSTRASRGRLFGPPLRGDLAELHCGSGLFDLATIEGRNWP
jgi:hypothetical protein